MSSRKKNAAATKAAKATAPSVEGVGVSSSTIPPAAIKVAASKYAHSLRRHAQSRALLSDFTEIFHLTRLHGGATARMWHEVVHEGKGTRRASDRNFERMKGYLAARSIPFRQILATEIDVNEVPTAAAIVLTVRPKLCPKCGAVKAGTRDFFDERASRADGLQPWCKPCMREATSAVRKSTVMDTEMQSREARRQRILRKSDKWTSIILRSREVEKGKPERDAARHALARALASGKIVKPACCDRVDCPFCRNDPRAHLAAFWPDPSRAIATRLTVEWYCRPMLARKNAERRAASVEGGKS